MIQCGALHWSKTKNVDIERISLSVPTSSRPTHILLDIRFIIIHLHIVSRFIPNCLFH